MPVPLQLTNLPNYAYTSRASPELQACTEPVVACPCYHQRLALTLRPMFLAVPSIILTTESTLVALVSGSFFWAISSTCFLVTCPTLTELGLPEPDSMPASANCGRAARQLKIHAGWPLKEPPHDHICICATCALLKCACLSAGRRRQSRGQADAAAGGPPRPAHQQPSSAGWKRGESSG